MMRDSISVLVPTYNRSAILLQTLHAFTKVRVEGLLVRWIVIDNNSTDSTPDVVDQFKSRLPILYYFEPRPGKNCALNKAIQECDLGDIVVFTDDDVTPAVDWLSQIAGACSKYREYDVFGGRIHPKYPFDRIPPWAEDQFIQKFAFALHDWGAVPKEYPQSCFPFGGNFWIRKVILTSDCLYNEAVGPSPGRRTMGSESTFLQNLAGSGHRMLYFPDALIEHRIQVQECSTKSVARRAVRLGRGEIYLSGLPRPKLRDTSRLLWCCYLLLKLAYGGFSWVGSSFSLSERQRFRREVDALRVIGNALESLHLQGNSVATRVRSA